MRAIAFQSSTAYLLDDEPDWPITVKAALPVDEEIGITGRQARRALGLSLRLRLEYGAVLEAAAIKTWRGATEVLSTEKILCPLWMEPMEAGAAASVQTDWYVLMGDGSDPELQPSSAWPFARPGYPLLVGRLEQVPDPRLYHDELCTIQVVFIEDDSIALTLPAYAPQSGPAAGGSARPILDLRPNWSGRPGGGAFQRPIDRRYIGQGRAAASAYYDQSGRRYVDYAFLLADAEPWSFLRFYLDCASANFWLPGGLADARLEADVGATDFSVTADQAFPYAASSGYALLDDGLFLAPLEILDGSGPVWTLSAAVGRAFTAAHTRIDSLLLARFDTESLTLSWDRPGLAQVSVKFQEVPEEISAPAGETIGTTMGALPALAYLYRFHIDYPGATEAWHLTSFESDLLWGGYTYSAARIEHDDIFEEASFRRGDLNVSLRHFEGSPIARLIPFRLQWPLWLEIYEADLAAGAVSAVRCVFRGEVVNLRSDGPYLQAACKTFNWVLERKIPRRLIQQNCNWALFETGCGLDSDDWKWQGLVTAYNATTLELALESVARVSGPAVTLAEHYFAGGWLLLGSGIAAQFVSIGDSAAAAGSDLTLVLMRAFVSAPSGGETIYFHPGCDGLLDTCVDKFANRERFGGFPFVPVGNPSALQVSKNVTEGGKK